MEIGISTATFFGKCLTENSFDEMRKIGVNLSEIFMTTYSEYTEEFGDLVKSKLGDIKVHSIHTLNSQFEPQLFNDAPRTRQDAEEIFLKALSNGEKWGAKYYTFHGIGMLKNKPYVYDSEKISKKINRLIDLAESRNIVLSFENVHWAMYSKPGFFKGVKKYCPKLKGTLDIKQAFQSGVCYKEYLKEMGQNISTVHLCDYTNQGKLCAIGEGDFDFNELFKVLREEGINAPVIVELYSGDYEDFSAIKNSVDYLKSLL